LHEVTAGCLAGATSRWRVRSTAARKDALSRAGRRAACTLRRALVGKDFHGKAPDLIVNGWVQRSAPWTVSAIFQTSLHCLASPQKRTEPIRSLCV